jgi:chaperonin GroEL
MNKKILFKGDARKSVLKGINTVADAVKVTLGYGGRTVIISDGANPTRTTKDGVTVANSIYLKDDTENAGAKLIREISSKTAQDVGDGTTTVCVLIQKLVTDGIRLVEAGMNPIQIKEEMDVASKIIVEKLKSVSIPVTSVEELKHVASVSANNDSEIGELIGSAYDQIGKFGNIHIEESKNSETTMEVKSGFQFNCGWFDNNFINTPDNKTVYDNPYLLIADKALDSFEKLKGIIEQIVFENKDRPIVILADDFDYSIIRDLLLNHQIIKSLCIKYNYMPGETRDELIQDLCALTGATLISDKLGKKIENIDLSYLGSCDKITTSKSDSFIEGFHGNEKNIELRKEDAKIKIEDAKNPMMKELRERRLAKLIGKVAICYVGGNSEIEKSEKHDRIDDSIRATKAALEEGILPGGGVSLLRCIEHIPATSIGGKLVIEAIKEPFRHIVLNSGFGSPDLLLEKVLGSSFQTGFNAKTNQLENLIESGVIDPVKVVRVCVENAISGAAQVIISEALIVNDENV